MANILGIVGVIVTAVSLLFAILACALDYWGKVEAGNTETHWGLWNLCVKVGDNKNCESFSSDNSTDETLDEMRVMRAMVLLGLILLIPALVVGILVLFVMKDKKILFFVAGGISIVAGLFLMVGFAYYTDEVYDSDTSDLGAAFALDIVAWLLAWIGGALFIVAKIMDKE